MKQRLLFIVLSFFERESRIGNSGSFFLFSLLKRENGMEQQLSFFCYFLK